MRRPHVTIITPCLNHADALERAICSVLDQDYPHVQHLVIDGGSDDGTLDILRTYEDVTWESQPDEGPIDAINRGLARAEGEIIGILHADQVLLPGCLHAMANLMTSAQAPSWVAGDVAVLDRHDQSLDTLHAIRPDSLASHLMGQKSGLRLAGMFFHREIFQHHGTFDPLLEFTADHDFFTRLLVAGLMPTLLPAPWAGQPAEAPRRDAAQLLQASMERLRIARRHARMLPAPQRLALWHACDQQQRQAALTHAQLYGRIAQRFLLQQVLARPWWLIEAPLRKSLLQGLAPHSDLSAAA